MEKIIEIKKVSKKYKGRDTFAVNNISMEVCNSEIVAVLGPNGSGKSTLIKMLLGIVKPTSGKILFFGKNPVSFNNQDKTKIGVYLGGKSNLIYHLPVIDSVALSGKIYKVSSENFHKRLEYFSEILKCNEFLNQRVATLSLGQKIRAEMLCILIFMPRIIILDEPTLGMDIEGKRQLRIILKELSGLSDISVIITTHDVNDMERLCDRIILISKGTKVMEEKRENFMELLDRNEIILTDKPIRDIRAKKIEEYGERYRYIIEKKHISNIDLFQVNRCVVIRERATLEDIFYDYYT